MLRAARSCHTNPDTSFRPPEKTMPSQVSPIRRLLLGLGSAMGRRQPLLPKDQHSSLLVMSSSKEVCTDHSLRGRDLCDLDHFSINIAVAGRKLCPSTSDCVNSYIHSAMILQHTKHRSRPSLLAHDTLPRRSPIFHAGFLAFFASADQAARLCSTRARMAMDDFWETTLSRDRTARSH